MTKPAPEHRLKSNGNPGRITKHDRHRALWASAAEVAREHGVFRTAKILRLEYAKLKRMAESAAPRQAKSRIAGGVLGVGRAPSGAAGSGLTECVIELEGPRGKMRIQWKGAAAPDLAGLSRGLWESA